MAENNSKVKVVEGAKGPELKTLSISDLVHKLVLSIMSETTDAPTKRTERLKEELDRRFADKK